MKTKIFFAVILFVLILGLGIGVLNKERPKTVTEEKPQKPDAIAFLIDKINTPVKGQEITPKTTRELRAWFSQTNLVHTPRFFITGLPEDFAQQGDKDLFAKVISALILRENERVLKERAVLILLRNKLNRGENWSEAETDFFNALVDKYDAKARKTIAGQIADLMPKLDIIPPMTAVIMAAEATDWGKKNLSSPFEQTGWLDNKTYAPIPFDSWVKATESYALEMNGMPPLEGWRVMRSNLRGQGYTDVGFRMLRWMSDYKPEDMFYKERLHKRAEELGYEIPDALTFQKSRNLGFETGKITINKKDFSVEFAKTREQLEYGLMFRNELKDGHGMVFLYPEPIKAGVWMKNTFIPLDVLFFNTQNEIVGILENLEPLDETPRMAEVPVKGFIELPAGTIQKHQIKVGDKIRF